MEHTTNQSRFRDCPRCGNPVSVDAVECQNCGFRMVETMVAEREAMHEQRFIGALIKRNPRFTPFFVGANIALFGLMWLAGGMGFLDANQAVLVGFGAKVNGLVNEGQYWRLVTCIFIHIGFLHLFLNNYALWMIGQEIERFYGSSRFVLIYLLTGLAGSLASYIYISDPKNVSAGASGAIFGLFGVMVTFPYRYRKEIPDALRKGIIRNILPVIILNLALGFSIQMIDQAAHIGGLIAGVALAMLIPYKRPGERMTALVWRVMCVLCIAVIFASFITAFSHYQMPPLRLENLTSNPAKEVKNYWTNLNQGLQHLGESDDAFRPILEKKDSKLVARDALEKIELGIEAVNQAPSIDEEADGYRQRMLNLLRDQKKLIENYNRSESKDWNSLMRERNGIIDEANQFIKDYQAWMPGFLEKYGYRVTDPSKTDS